MGVGDDKEVVAVEFFGSFDEAIEFAFAGFLGCHIVADLDQLLYFCAFAGNEVYLFVVACTVENPVSDDPCGQVDLTP